MTLAMVAMAGFTGCGLTGGEDPGDEPKPYQKIVLTQEQEAVQACENDFALGLFRNVVAKQKDTNLMISPFSASLCLSMAAAGANGETFTQMATTLGFAGFSAEQIGSYYETMCKGLYEADNTTTLKIANAVWPAVNFPLKKAYGDFAKRYYSATVENLDFGQQSAVNTVNNWAYTNTNGMIPKILDEPEPAIRLMLANALYFNGKWSGGEMQAQQKDFTDFTGKTAKVKFLGSTREMGYCEGEGFTACSVPYGNGAYRMVIFLPDKGKSLAPLVAKLTPDFWNQTLKQLHTCDVIFSMPVFKSEYEMSDVFMETLAAMGMQLPFTGAADFSKMTDEALYIDEILQKTAIDVTEKGTEAAAVTAIVYKNTSVSDPIPPKVFTADRPFAYAIIEQSFNTVLFIGIHGK